MLATAEAPRNRRHSCFNIDIQTTEMPVTSKLISTGTPGMPARTWSTEGSTAIAGTKETTWMPTEQGCLPQGCLPQQEGKQKQGLVLATHALLNTVIYN